MGEPPAPVAYRLWTPLDSIDGDPAFSLKGLNTEFFPDGAAVYVRAAGVLAQYFLRKGSTAAADDASVVQPVVNSNDRWHRYPSSGGDSTPWPGTLDCGPMLDGVYREVTPTGDPFPDTITWYADATKAVTLLVETITRNADQTPATIVWTVNNLAGALVRTITDTITYTNLIESTRTRSVVEA